MLKCVNCAGVVSDKKHPSQKYCSRDCWRQHKAAPKTPRLCAVCGSPFLARVNQVKNGWGKYCSRQCYFKVPKSPETIEKMRHIGDKHPNWKGGIMKGRKDRNLSIYKNWRYQVFKRDNFTCQHCDKRGGYLEADHIKSWTDYPELRYEVNNGRTLCKDCHSKRTAQQHRERMSYVA